MFKAVRTVYFENDKRKVTEKKYETYKQAKAYAKRYSKLVNGARFIEVEIKFDTDSFKFKNIDIFVADSNGFENEHLSEIEKFQKETEEQNVKYTVSRFACSPEKEFDTVDEARLFAEECAKNGFVYTINKVQGTTAQVIEEIEPQKSEKRYNFYVKDYTEKRDVPIVYSDYTKKEIIKEVQGWADKNNHVYKIFIADKTSDKTLAGRVFFKVINWKPIFKVGKTGSRLQFGEFNYEDAEAYCKEYARKDGIAYTIYEVKFDKFGRDEFVPVTDIEPPEKDYRASEQKQATEVKPDEQTTEEKEYIFFSPKTGRYAARRFRGTEEAVIADTERRIEERDYARDFCLVIREVISKGKSKFIKAINWNDDYRIACGWYSEIVYSKEEAIKKAEELANKEKKAVNVYVTYLNSNGHAVEKIIDTIEPDKQETTEEPTEKVVVPAYGVEQHTHYELEYNEYDETGYMVGENEAKFKTVEEATACADELIKNVGENNIVLRLYKVTGEDFECLFTKHASRIHGLVAIAEDKPVQTVAETPAEYVTDSELISMLVKEPVSASLYDFMREPQKVKISKKGRKRLNAVREIVKRALVALPEEKTMIGTVEDAANLMMKRLRYKNKECFYAIILDTKNKVVNISKITEGYLNGSIVHPTDVFKEILRYETACSVIFCHNHPSGDPTPSTEDINITFRLVKAGKVLDIEVLDHIIIGDGIYKSFKKDGLLNNNATSLPWLESEGR